MSDALSIVQFTHPGAEHGPDKGQKTKSWNNGGHKRKFLSSKGIFVGPAGGKEKGDLCFWGEWEPPSKIIGEHKKAPPNYPRWLHEPFIPENYKELLGEQSALLSDKKCGRDGKCGPRRYQNTDPFVFGRCFKYAICKQSKRRKGAGASPTGLTKLAPGSLILFGSTFGKKSEDVWFQLDTVFVVSRFDEYGSSLERREPLEFLNGDEYADVSFKMAYPTEDDYPEYQRVYYGATYDKPFEGMYSFSPARVRDKSGETPPWFLRVKLKNKPYLANNLNAAPKISRNDTSGKALEVSDIREFWEQVRQICREQGCVEAVRLDMPPHERAKDGR